MSAILASLSVVADVLMLLAFAGIAVGLLAILALVFLGKEEW